VSDQPGIGLSEVVPVRRVDPFDVPVDGGRNPADPLHFAGGKVTPSLDGVYRGRDRYPALHGGLSGPNGGAPRLSIEFCRWEAGFQRLARAAACRPDRRHPLMSSIQPAPGQYEIRVTARQGGSAASRMIALRVQ
jgi:hypothetical protein